MKSNAPNRKSSKSKKIKKPPHKGKAKGKASRSDNS